MFLTNPEEIPQQPHSCLIPFSSFNCSSPLDIKQLDTFLQEIKYGTMVLTASYDDAATK